MTIFSKNMGVRSPRDFFDAKKSIWKAKSILDKNIRFTKRQESPVRKLLNDLDTFESDAANLTDRVKASEGQQIKGWIKKLKAARKGLGMKICRRECKWVRGKSARLAPQLRQDDEEFTEEEMVQQQQEELVGDEEVEETGPDIEVVKEEEVVDVPKKRRRRATAEDFRNMPKHLVENPETLELLKWMKENFEVIPKEMDGRYFGRVARIDASIVATPVRRIM